MAGPDTSAATSTTETPSEQSQSQPATKFLGKYTSLEEAERGYKELERFAYEQSRRATDAQKQLETLASQPQFQGAPYGYAPAGTVPGYAGYPGFIDPRQEAELQQFSTNPLEYLRRRDTEVEKRAIDRARQEFRGELAARDTLGQWKSENPDLVRHEPLVATFVAQQPAHLSIREKLDRAGEEARRYLASEISRQARTGTAPNPNQVVESPFSGGDGVQHIAPFQEPVTSEGELADYIKERNTWKQQRQLR